VAEAVNLPAEELSMTLPNQGGEMKFVRIAAGSFRMGQRGVFPNEEPVHEVLIPEDFYLAIYPVTQMQFAAWTQSPAYRLWFAPHQHNIRSSSSGHEAVPHQNRFAGRSYHPAEQVTWWEAQAYTQWLAAEAVVPHGWKAMLPNEAQWEYACRAGTATDYFSGDGEAALNESGWYGENSEERTYPVGQKLQNAWGLYDMHGNVMEWCLDIFDSSCYRRRVDGIPWEPILHSEKIEPMGVNPKYAACAEIMSRYGSAKLQVLDADRSSLNWLKTISEKSVANGDPSWQPIVDLISVALRAGEWPMAAISAASDLYKIFQSWINQCSGNVVARVLRGGCWSSSARTCRSAFRGRESPGMLSFDNGFRLALVRSSG
jgi:formylglycine-generating enzyme required for sulfatase activity